MKSAAIGIDIGATWTKYTVMTRDGETLVSGRIPTSGHVTFQQYLDDLVMTIKPLISSVGNEVQIAGVGIGAPNGNYYSGCIEHAANLPWKGILPVVRDLSDRFGLLAVMTNDANIAAIGEMFYGKAGNLKDFISITLGTGLGSGIAAGGRLLLGSHGIAGELGHTLAKPDGRICGCGKKGCLETYVSSPGVVRTALELMAKYRQPSPMRNTAPADLTSEMICRFAGEGDQTALEVFEFTGKILGIKLADAVQHTDPEAIFFSGGLAAAGDLLLVPAKKYMEENLQTAFRNKVPLILSGLPPETGAASGACALVWMETSDRN